MKTTSTQQVKAAVNHSFEFLFTSTTIDIQSYELVRLLDVMTITPSPLVVVLVMIN